MSVTVNLIFKGTGIWKFLQSNKYIVLEVWKIGKDGLFWKVIELKINIIYKNIKYEVEMSFRNSLSKTSFAVDKKEE